MQIYRRLEEYRGQGRCVAALGSFDGVHIGHQEILAAAVREAELRGCIPACYTFSTHPREHLKSSAEGQDLRYLTTDEDKLALLEAAGMALVLDVPFDEHVKRLSAVAFIQDVLLDRLHVAAVSCGFNYRFGARAAGDVEFLVERGRALGYAALVHEAVQKDGEVVSSTAIRAAVEAGNMEKAASFLGRPYRLDGIVQHGQHLGASLGYSTANLSLDERRVLPPDGVYFTRACLNGKTYPAMSNLGCRPTLGGGTRSLETHILGWHGELYGRRLGIDFLAWHRAERTFASPEALSRQLDADRAAALRYHEGKSMLY